MDASHQGRYDCVFSSHVIEHVPSPAKAFEYAFKLLRNEGLFVSFTPNGSSAARARNPNWKKLWGEVHSNFVDEEFLERSFRQFASHHRIFAGSWRLSARNNWYSET